MGRSRKLRAPSPAMTVACISLAVALSGASYAAITLPKNSVGTKQIRNNAVKSAKIGPNQVKGVDVDEATLGQVPSAGFAANAASAANADKLDGSDSTEFVRYKSTIVVSPVGAASANGQALLDALARITSAGASNPYLLKIEPGIYDLGGNALLMKPYVDIEGSGEGVTVVKRPGSEDHFTGTLVGANNAELRSLTVENYGGATGAAKAIFSNGTSPRLAHVTAIASAGSPAIAVQNYNTAATQTRPILVDVTAKASARIELSASAFAVHNTSSSPTMTNLTASGVIAGDSSYGVWNEGDSDPIIRDSVVSAAGGASHPAELANTGALASSGAAVFVVVESSTLIGFGSGGVAIFGFYGSATRVAASQVSGGPYGAVSTGDGATVKCVASYNGSFDPLSATCM
jgi:hypothetical protein